MPLNLGTLLSQEGNASAALKEAVKGLAAALGKESHAPAAAPALVIVITQIISELNESPNTSHCRQLYFVKLVL